MHIYLDAKMSSRMVHSKNGLSTMSCMTFLQWSQVRMGQVSSRQVAQKKLRKVKNSCLVFALQVVPKDSNIVAI